MLNQTDIRQFKEQGYLVVRDCVPEASARGASQAIWTDLMARHDVTEDSSTWRGQYVNFGATALKGRDTMLSEAMREVFDDLLGIGRWRSDHDSKSGGTVFASLPRIEQDHAWSVAGEWHWDQGENRHLPNYTGIQACTLLTDMAHRGGEPSLRAARTTPSQRTSTARAGALATTTQRNGCRVSSARKSGSEIWMAARCRRRTEWQPSWTGRPRLTVFR